MCALEPKLDALTFCIEYNAIDEPFPTRLPSASWVTSCNEYCSSNFPQFKISIQNPSGDEIHCPSIINGVFIELEFIGPPPFTLPLTQSGRGIFNFTGGVPFDNVAFWLLSKFILYVTFESLFAVFEIVRTPELLSFIVNEGY
jgi:hypothetical protein